MRPWEKYVRRVVPYVPGEQPKFENMVKLNTNENPFPPTKRVQEAAQKFDTELLKYYPDPEASALTETLADYYGVNKNQVYVGVGSDDVISMAFLTFFNSDKPILFPDISYSFYSVWAELYRIPYVRPLLDKDFKIIPSDYIKANGGIIFPNPNAPTAVYMELGAVEEIIRNNRHVVVIVDEAYIDFGGKSALELVEKYDNLLVVQTFSKSRSMAGIRIGFAIGNPVLIKAMSDVKFSFNSYTMNTPSLCYGVEAIKDDVYFKECCNRIIDIRENAKNRFSQLGFTFTESKANFLFATHGTVKAEDIFKELKKRRIYVRYFNSPRIDNYLRITVGTEAEMEKLFAALEEIVK